MNKHCHISNGVLIPGCMGVAAASGCGKNLKDILSFCTCSKPSTKDLETKIKELEERIKAVEALTNK